MPDARPEILAPAGGPAQLDAAIAAGADAVYLGLGELDARRGAVGFAVAELPELVAKAHAAGVRVHLTLNIQLGARELGRAARTLRWAEQSGVDAVLLADPGLFLLAPLFPRLAFHVSTQAGISSRAGVAAVAALGARRVVLAREMALAEIAPCVGQGPEIEIFAQGAICFSVSGRCSLTSWVGGHSGNRGTCTSICRVGWSCNGAATGRPMDMKDLSAVRLLPDIARIGVASLKIEGRLKAPEWVGSAIGLFKRGLAGAATPAELWAEAERLGAYTGREMTDGYLDGRRVGLVHPDEGRASGGGERCDDQDPPRALMIDIHAQDRDLRWELRLGAATGSFVTNRPQAHRGRSVGHSELKARIAESLPEGVTLAGFTNHSLGLLMPRRTANEIAARIAQWARPREDGIDRLKIDVGEAVREALAPRRPHPGNRLSLDAAPAQARLDAAAAPAFAAAVPGVRLVVEVRAAEQVEALHAALGSRWAAALPPVIYEADLPALEAAAAACARLGVAVEANGWDGLGIARAAGCLCEAGPGLAAYNPLAARQLAALGCRSVYAGSEIDGAMLADLCAACEAPLTVCVYGRPQLMTTRAWSNAPAWAMEDGRGTVRIRTRREGPVVVLRPEEPFDWRTRRVGGVRAAVLEMDLSSAADPLAEWRSRPDPRRAAFNLERELA